MTRGQIVEALSLQEREGVAYWDAFDIPTFFRPIGVSWSPAETVRHLVRSSRPIAAAFSTSPILLRLKFGRSKRPSMRYDDLVACYLKALREGGKAGQYAPSRRRMHDLEIWRAYIMSNFLRAHKEIRTQVGSWSESNLDRLQLPHPLLGPLTMREMAYFALYHQRHHIQVVQRNLSAHPVVVTPQVRAVAGGLRRVNKPPTSLRFE